MTNTKTGDFIVSALDLPADLGKGVPRLVLWDHRHLLIENYGGIVAFSAEELKIGNGNKAIAVTGKNLVLEVLTKAEIEVCGKVETVVLTEAEADEN